MSGQEKQPPFLSGSHDNSLWTLILFAIIAVFATAALSHIFAIGNVWLHAVFTSGFFILCLAAYKQFLTPQRPTDETRDTAPAQSQEKGRRNLEIAIAEGLQEAIFIVDRNAMITYANQAARRLFPDLTLRYPLSNYVRDPDVSQLVTETLAGKIATPQSIVRPGSVDRHLRVSGSPIITCLLYTSPSPRDGLLSRMPSSA